MKNRFKLVDENDNEITVDQLVERYLSNPEICFIEPESALRSLSLLDDISPVVAHRSFLFFLHPTWRRIFTRLQENRVEQSSNERQT